MREVRQHVLSFCSFDRIEFTGVFYRKSAELDAENLHLTKL